MKATTGQDVQAPASAQQQLAHQLVDCLGREAAIHVCKANGWNGVLKLILSEDDDPAHVTPALV